MKRPVEKLRNSFPVCSVLLSSPLIISVKVAALERASITSLQCRAILFCF